MIQCLRERGRILNFRAYVIAGCGTLQEKTLDSIGVLDCQSKSYTSTTRGSNHGEFLDTEMIHQGYQEISLSLCCPIIVLCKRGPRISRSGNGNKSETMALYTTTHKGIPWSSRQQKCIRSITPLFVFNLPLGCISHLCKSLKLRSRSSNPGVI